MLCNTFVVTHNIGSVDMMCNLKIYDFWQTYIADMIKNVNIAF